MVPRVRWHWTVLYSLASTPGTTKGCSSDVYPYSWSASSRTRGGWTVYCVNTHPGVSRRDRGLLGSSVLVQSRLTPRVVSPLKVMVFPQKVPFRTVCPVYSRPVPSGQ